MFLDRICAESQVGSIREFVEFIEGRVRMRSHHAYHDDDALRELNEQTIRGSN